MQKFIGLPASPGVAIGPAWVYRPLTVTVERRVAADPPAEWARLQSALFTARMQLQALEARARENIGDKEAAIFEAHQMFLEDEELLAS
ncbi:MAG: phosphoenolpyruvate-utilizing N-terminal domain-containing protein, partial [Anaerolineales bacterium]|nr:phosphoenolpyruvate-utilizing N-terminal domain-containing protein [Anaerolineales bacterium]